MADFKATLLEVLLSIAKELNYEPVKTIIKPISGEGANYTSELFEATISAAGKDDINVFAKVASMSSEMRAIRTGNLYTAEIYCYAELLKKYKDLETQHKVPKEHCLNVPKFYGANDEYMKETVVLENLTANGYETYDRFNTISWEYAAQSIKQLAIFHALSIALSKYDHIEFEKTKTWLTSVYKFKDMADMIKGILTNALKTIKEENRARLADFIQARIDGNYFDELLEPVKCPVIVHGDFRTSNIMHRIDKNGAYKIVPVDYQAARHGCPVTDLLFFIFSGSDKKFRAQYFKESIELYYKELCDALRRLNVDPNEMYPREDFDYEYQKVLPYGLIVGVFVLPVVTVEAENAPKPEKISDVNIQPNNLYKERLNDIVEDFIEMGVL